MHLQQGRVFILLWLPIENPWKSEYDAPSVHSVVRVRQTHSHTHTDSAQTITPVADVGCRQRFHDMFL